MESGQAPQNTHAPPVPPTNEELVDRAYYLLLNGNADPEAQSIAAAALKQLLDDNVRYKGQIEYLAKEVEGLKNASFAKAAESFQRSRSNSLGDLFRPDNDDNQDEMVVDKTPVRPKLPLKKAGDELLQNTKAMKSAARNLVSRLARLRTRLVKLNGVNNVPNMKKFYQFRLISEDSSELKIYEENKKALDEKVGHAVLETLKKDVTEQIQAVKSTLNETAPKLKKELEELKEQVLQNPDLSTSEKADVSAKWTTNITYNVDWLNAEILKLQTSQVPKVPPKPKSLQSATTDKRKMLTLNPKKRKTEGSSSKVSKKPKGQQKGTNKKPKGGAAAKKAKTTAPVGKKKPTVPTRPQNKQGRVQKKGGKPKLKNIQKGTGKKAGKGSKNKSKK